MRGRPAKPRELKILQGTFRPDRDRSLVSVGGATPEPPDHLAGEALKFWRSVVPGLAKMGILCELDAPMLSMMCWWYAEARRFADAAEKADLSDLKAHRRLLVMASLCAGHFDKIAARFGMTPADRARLRIDPTPVVKGVDHRKR